MAGDRRESRDLFQAIEEELRIARYSPDQQEALEWINITQAEEISARHKVDGKTSENYDSLVERLCTEFCIGEKCKCDMLEAKFSEAEEIVVTKVKTPAMVNMFVFGFFVTYRRLDGLHDIAYAIYKCTCVYHTTDERPIAEGTLEKAYKYKAIETLTGKAITHK